MTRRIFLKTIAALAGIAAVPALGHVVNVPEPVWVVNNFDLDYSTGVAAKWPDGTRHAVAMYGIGKPSKKEISYCKQALRQWYKEKHGL